MGQRTIPIAPHTKTSLGTKTTVVTISQISSLFFPSATISSLVALCAIIMAFQTTATIASFGGKLLKLSHKASSTNCDMALNLYLPPQAYQPNAKVPVLFYLSGLTCTGDNCSEKGFFQHGASQKGIAIVYPDTSPSALH